MSFYVIINLSHCLLVLYFIKAVKFYLNYFFLSCNSKKCLFQYNFLYIYLNLVILFNLDKSKCTNIFKGFIF